MQKRNFLSYLAFAILLLNSKIPHAEAELVSGVNIEYTYSNSKWISAQDTQEASIMNSLKTSYSYFFDKSNERVLYQYVLPNYFPKISLSQNTYAWTNKDVNITAEFTLDSKAQIVSKKWEAGRKSTSYFSTGGIDIPQSNTFTVTTNDVYTVYVKDTYDNETTNYIEVDNIDKGYPYATAYIKNVDSSGFDIYISNITDLDSGINRIEFYVWRDSWSTDGKIYTIYRPEETSTQFRVNISDFNNKTGVYYVDIKIHDNAGNGDLPISYLTANIPNPKVLTSPVFITNYEYSSGGVYWVKAGDYFTAKFSGYTTPENSRYKITSEFILAISESSNDFFGNFKSFIAKTPLSYSNYVKSYDVKPDYSSYTSSLNLVSGSYSQRTGNTSVDSLFNFTLTGDEAVKLGNIVRVETDDTIIDSTIDTDKVLIKSDANAPTISFTPNPNKIWSKTNVTLSIDIVDGRSGIENWTVRRKVNDSSWINLLDKTSFLTLTEDGVHVVEVTATDNVGNYETKNITINIDKTVPSITIPPFTMDSETKDILVSPTVIDITSGVSIKKWAVGIKNKSYFALNGNILYSSFKGNVDTTYTIYAKDYAGNESVNTVTIENTDLFNPVITGDFDNSWVRSYKTIIFKATDDFSGVNSLKLWDKDKSYVLKNGSVSNGEGYLSYTVFEEGETYYKIEAIDNLGKVETKNVTVRIDNTNPTADVTIPSVTNNITVTMSLENIIDKHSGARDVWVCESPNFDTRVTKDIIAGFTNKQFTFNLEPKDTFDSHFSERTVYIRIYDNVGNYSSYTRKIRLIPANPKVPTFILPTENYLYIEGESISLKWTYESKDLYIGELLQIKSEITLVHKKGSKEGLDLVYKYTINGDVDTLDLHDLKFGDYEVTVKVFNCLEPEVYAKSEVRKFRYNKFQSSGNVYTEDITTSSPIKYLSIATTFELPVGSTIEGFIYYDKGSSGKFNLNNCIPFKIAKGHETNDIVKLPRKTNELKIEYKLTGSSSNSFVSPTIDTITVLGR